jgi:hypothetical protein
VLRSLPLYIFTALYIGTVTTLLFAVSSNSDLLPLVGVSVTINNGFRI